MFGRLNRAGLATVPDLIDLELKRPENLPQPLRIGCTLFGEVARHVNFFRGRLGMSNEIKMHGNHLDLAVDGALAMSRYPLLLADCALPAWLGLISNASSTCRRISSPFFFQCATNRSSERSLCRQHRSARSSACP